MWVSRWHCLPPGPRGALSVGSKTHDDQHVRANCSHAPTTPTTCFSWLLKTKRKVSLLELSVYLVGEKINNVVLSRTSSSFSPGDPVLVLGHGSLPLRVISGRVSSPRASPGTVAPRLPAPWGLAGAGHVEADSLSTGTQNLFAACVRVLLTRVPVNCEPTVRAAVTQIPVAGVSGTAFAQHRAITAGCPVHTQRGARTGLQRPVLQSGRRVTRTRRSAGSRSVTRGVVPEAPVSPPPAEGLLSWLW